MSPPDSRPQVPAAVERSGVVASPQPACAVCGSPRDPRKRETCSDKCRAALSRQRQAEAGERRDREVRELLEAALKRLAEKGDRA
jgi:predicted nucleic acid-binding Zn ribbon protein